MFMFMFFTWLPDSQPYWESCGQPCYVSWVLGLLTWIEVLEVGGPHCGLPQRGSPCWKDITMWSNSYHIHPGMGVLWRLKSYWKWHSVIGWVVPEVLKALCSFETSELLTHDSVSHPMRLKSCQHHLRHSFLQPESVCLLWLYLACTNSEKKSLMASAARL